MSSQRDVSHFSSFSRFCFTVQMGSSTWDAESRIGHGEHGLHGRVGTENVDHGCGRHLQGCGTKRKGEDGSEVVFELRSVTSFDSVVTRIVRSWCNLVQLKGSYLSADVNVRDGAN